MTNEARAPSNSYRPDGMRHHRVDNSGTQQMVWDRNDVLAWVNSGGSLGQFFTRGAKLVKTYTSPTTQLYYHADALGTIGAYSKPDGSTYARAILDAWGGNATAMGYDPYSFVGEQGYWGELGQLHRPLYYVRARWLAAGGPGWLSPDPVSIDLLRRFMYVDNCPTRLVDFTGLATQAVIGLDDSPRIGLPAAYHPESTEAIRVELLFEQIKAGFFVIGQRFDSCLADPRYPWTMNQGPNPLNNAGLAAMQLTGLAEEGHILGNHTYCHQATWWPQPRAFPDGHTQVNPHPCNDVATCAARWQVELCRNQLVVLAPGMQWMTEYRTPGLNWDIQVLGPVTEVLRPYVYRGDNSNDPSVRRTVLTLHDEVDMKNGRSPNWSDIRELQIRPFLTRSHPNDTLYIFLHDQPSHATYDINDQPRGAGLLYLVIHYLLGQGIKIADYQGVHGQAFTNCVDRLREIYESHNPQIGVVMAQSALSGTSPSLS